MDSLPAVARSGRICDALPPRPTADPAGSTARSSAPAIGPGIGAGAGTGADGHRGGARAPSAGVPGLSGDGNGGGVLHGGGGGSGVGGGVTQQLQSSPAAAQREQAKDRISERMFHVKHPFCSEPYSRTSTPPLSEEAASPSRVRFQTAPKKLRALPARAYPGLGDQRNIILPIRSWTRSEPVVGFLRPRVSNSRKRPVRKKHLAIQTPAIAP